MSLFWRSKKPEERFDFVSGNVVTPSSFADVSVRPEVSLQKVAVWAAVDLISSLSSELPVDVFRGQGPGKEHLQTPAWLLDPAGDGNGLEDWVFQAMSTWLLRGNIIGYVRDFAPKGAYPTAVELLNFDRMNVHLDKNGQPVWLHEGVTIPPERVFHRRVYPVSGDVLGMSPIRYHASTIGLGLAITQFGRQWFTDGAHPGGMLTNSEIDLTPQVASTAKQRFVAALRGSREPVVLGKGWEYKQIQIAPEESQFLESNQFTSADCARIFGPGMAEILGYETGGPQTYVNVEARLTQLLVLSLNRWLRRMERTLSMMLPRGQWVQINRDALLQSTTIDRLRAYQIALQSRIRTVNEVRELEDLPPVEWGNAPVETTPVVDDDQSED